MGQMTDAEVQRIRAGLLEDFRSRAKRHTDADGWSIAPEEIEAKFRSYFMDPDFAEDLGSSPKNQLKRWMRDGETAWPQPLTRHCGASSRGSHGS